jgi:hypothetical protein
MEKHPVKSTEANCENALAESQQVVDNSCAALGKLPIRFGLLKGKISVAEDFDAPLPADILDSFEQE